MKAQNKKLKKYYRSIRSWLPCSGKLKKKILGEIHSTIETYQAENPDADFADIEKRYGSPKQIAASYIDEMETGELLWDLRIRRRVVRTVTAAVAAAVILWTVALRFALIQESDSDRGHGTTSIGNPETKGD